MSLSATILRTAFDCSGELAVSDLKLYFLGESAKTTQASFTRQSLIHTALELFTSTGDAFLVVFASEKDRSVLLQQFRTLRLEKLLVDHKTQLSYLMTLNKLAGRTFNDLMQYPIFPFVLSDYSSDTLDLTNPSSYRTLAKPMAIQDSRMEKVYAQNYQSLAEEYGRFNRSGDSGSSSHKAFSSVRFGPYHYGSHYSNTGIVAHYLVRIPPYTSVALEYQDNNFDIPDRLFGSMDTTWRLSSSESTTDFKELIPEFFYLYEMFRNSDELELGVRQSGDRVDHVQVPPWCPRGDQRLFCLIHRHALENHYVTANLHHWIDLIFGFKQSGENAVRAMNVFHPATYRGRDLEESSKGDPLIVCAIQTMVRTYGQMPLQLFDAPHLPHLNATKYQTQPATPKAHGTPSSMPVGPFHEQFHTVVGVRWGDFVGSPEHDGFYFSMPSRFFTPAIKCALHLVHCDPTTEICYGLPRSTELIAYYRSDRKDPLRRDNELALCAIVSWCSFNFFDNILRIKLIFAGQPHKKHFQLSPTTTDVPQQCWERLIDLQSLKLCRVAYSSAAKSLLLGFKCGLIRVYSLHYDQADDKDELSRKKWHCRLRSSLYAHSCAISSLSISDRFHVILSTSVDAKICLWDANKHNFERRFRPPPPVFSGSMPIEETVTLSCVSSTNADVAVVFQSGLVGSRIAMTDLAEGTAVNCVAIGLQSGVIRLIEMWTMTVVRDISFESFQTDIISLLFTNGSRRLYAAFANSQVLCWQVPSITAVESGGTATAGKEQPCFKVLNPFKS
uniref:WD_REPEATS_REGION domain-containing protein n=1 Tax=Globodera pallida TaxID=36090 RepID=A0A183BXV0_GLOPA